MTPNHVGTMMPLTWKEESISSVQRIRARGFIFGFQVGPVGGRSPLTRRALGGTRWAENSKDRDSQPTAISHKSPTLVLIGILSGAS